MQSKSTHTLTTTDASCKCGEHCTCHTSSCVSKYLTPVAIVAGAILISGSVFLSALNRPCHNAMRPKMQAGMSDKAIGNYIAQHPEAIVASLEKHYRAEQAKARKAQPAPQASADKKLVEEIVNDKTNHVLGNPKGKFVIIEFFDYQCGWCKKTNTEISSVLKDAPNIRWILMDTPIFGEASEQIARYAMAAGKQGKYKEYHEAIGKAKGKLDKEALVKLGKDLKLDTKRLTADADSKEVTDKLAKNQKYARQLNINGVPMLIVDGKINPGALIGDKLAEAVKASNAKK